MPFLKGTQNRYQWILCICTSLLSLQLSNSKILVFLNFENEWASKDGLHVIDYRNILRESMFTLCPWGINPESLRLYEAMEAGSIPIFQRLNASISPMTPMGADNPIPQ